MNSRLVCALWWQDASNGSFKCPVASLVAQFSQFVSVAHHHVEHKSQPDKVSEGHSFACNSPLKRNWGFICKGLQTPQVIKYTVVENLLSSDNSVTCPGACETDWLWIPYAETTGSDCHNLTWQLMLVSWATDQVMDLDAAPASHRRRKENNFPHMLWLLMPGFAWSKLFWC